MSADAEIEADLRMLLAAEEGAPAAFRTWRCARYTVVLGLSQKAEREANLDYCTARGIPVVRRRSGGGAVVIGPGTLQYAFALPYTLNERLRSIAASKAFCNGLLIDALSRLDARGLTLRHEPWGDLVLGGRKVGGLAMKRKRRAVLVHGTLLVGADLDVVAAALHHPSREPGYRGGRGHRDFVCNLGSIDEAALTRAVRDLLLELGE